ncbi:uncharacterized protein LOC122296790 [Carya illinoinensis]|uniref:uncharacterized protein LOC122296790 n=1 Tax=Carya illinoinensis TaxID=32201 RepID=UPI001C71DF44|nr:uncharacterized protein LOC122296790 [Carya illinoinensis]
MGGGREFEWDEKMKENSTQPPVFQTHSTLLTWLNPVRATSRVSEIETLAASFSRFSLRSLLLPRTSHSKLLSPSSARHFVPKGQKDLLQHNPSSCVLRCSLLLTHIDVSMFRNGNIKGKDKGMNS